MALIESASVLLGETAHRTPHAYYKYFQLVCGPAASDVLFVGQGVLLLEGAATMEGVLAHRLSVLGILIDASCRVVHS